MAMETATSMEEMDGYPLVKKRRFCPHCSQTVGYSTFYRHRDRYYDVDSNQWTTTTSIVGDREENNEVKASINTICDCRSDDCCLETQEASESEHVDYKTVKRMILIIRHALVRH